MLVMYHAASSEIADYKHRDGAQSLRHISTMKTTRVTPVAQPDEPRQSTHSRKTDSAVKTPRKNQQYHSAVISFRQRFPENETDHRAIPNSARRKKNLVCAINDIYCI